MTSESERPIPDEVREGKEQERELDISRIDPEDRDGIEAYYKFEVDHGFSEIDPKKTTLDGMVDFRQTQMREEKLKVAVANEGDELVATSVVVLENGTMGKEMGEDEAYAAGTVVMDGKRGGGIGEKMAAEQDKIAREAGKKSMVTVITNTNHPSMRLRMKTGYRLEGVEYRADEVNYRYRKDLTGETEESIDWVVEVADGRLNQYSGDFDSTAPDQILIDPENQGAVEVAIEQGYQGMHLLRPEDFNKGNEGATIEKNMVVFGR